MDRHDISRAPPEYLEVKWIADLCKLLMGLGWTTNYAGMIMRSIKDRTYSMSVMALCNNFAWEITYAFIYPFGSGLELYVHYTGLLINCGVMYTAVMCAARAAQLHQAGRHGNRWFCDIFRYKYWRADHEELATPLYIWFVCAFFVLDGGYGIALYYVKRFEKTQQAAAKSKEN
ncbi:uncharacterized protein PpBr36_10629 [Pyricularia pennisetigena]|uniref:uncharacterized protein n=1 Tax=Pyricularia pennisetigena TaxID=1578925 RepID=UPI00114E1B27|nr:uncharacterized protein PpBr36_10629 [Pyricularia pennisetigena]TLS21081.1 hypothetical protein PpBr36_10629 [Pyricularia pennisetigena]